MIGSSKFFRENYPRKYFRTQEKETAVKFNPGLSANRPSNNWAQRCGFHKKKKTFLVLGFLKQTLPGFWKLDYLTWGESG